MSSAERLYWCATTLLYSVLADWYFLFDTEDIRPPGKIIPSGPNGGRFESFAAWILDESRHVPEDLVSDIDPYDMMDGYAEKWINEIWSTTRSAHESYPQIELWQWMYYLYYQSVAQIIEEFERLMREAPICSSHLYTSYLDGAQNYTDHKLLLAPYLPSTGDGAVNSAILQIIAQQAAKSATDWRSDVVRAAIIPE